MRKVIDVEMRVTVVRRRSHPCFKGSLFLRGIHGPPAPIVKPPLAVMWPSPNRYSCPPSRKACSLHVEKEIAGGWFGGGKAPGQGRLEYLEDRLLSESHPSLLGHPVVRFRCSPRRLECDGNGHCGRGSERSHTEYLALCVREAHAGDEGEVIVIRGVACRSAPTSDRHHSAPRDRGKVSVRQHSPPLFPAP